jgi:hypothetical protein
LFLLKANVFKRYERNLKTVYWNWNMAGQKGHHLLDIVQHVYYIYSESVFAKKIEEIY